MDKSEKKDNLNEEVQKLVDFHVGSAEKFNNILDEKSLNNQIAANEEDDLEFEDNDSNEDDDSDEAYPIKQKDLIF